MKKPWPPYPYPCVCCRRPWGPRRRPRRRRLRRHHRRLPSLNHRRLRACDEFGMHHELSEEPFVTQRAATPKDQINKGRRQADGCLHVDDCDLRLLRNSWVLILSHEIRYNRRLPGAVAGGAYSNPTGRVVHEGHSRFSGICRRRTKVVLLFTQFFSGLNLGLEEWSVEYDRVERRDSGSKHTGICSKLATHQSIAWS